MTQTLGQPAVNPDPQPRMARWAGRSPLAVLLAAQLVLGVIAGVLWYAVSPRQSLSFVVPNGPHTSVIIPDETESQVATDGRYLIIVAVLGLAAGLIAWRLRRSRGPVPVIAVAVTALVAAFVTAQLGSALSSQGALTNGQFTQRLRLHAWPMLLVEPLLAALAYTVSALLCSDDDLGRGLEQPAAGEHGGGSGDRPELAEQFQFPPEGPARAP